ncbi:MAG: hypothetical protein Q7R43_04975 [Candidatus Daviesbacteria bacterium]|nr:hypothetical protein [Candidatus Daviesbacteria bacterium]
MLEFDIIQDNIPTVYEIGVGEDEHSLKIKTDSKTFQDINDHFKDPNHKWINFLKNKFRLSDFCSLPETDWGFGSVLKQENVENDSILWRCDLPEGKTKEISWPALYNISASLMVMFDSLSISEEKTSSQIPQLMHLSLSVGFDLHGGSMNAYFGKSIIPWLEKQPHDLSNKDIEQTMRNTDMHLNGKLIKHQDQYLYRFLAWTRQPCWINLMCPGDACGLDPEDYNDPRPDGYKLLPHNIDSPLQQLTFIMGLARMHDLARQDGF